jgi:hypothetical protein
MDERDRDLIDLIRAYIKDLQLTKVTSAELLYICELIHMHMNLL